MGHNSIMSTVVRRKAAIGQKAIGDDYNYYDEEDNSYSSGSGSGGLSWYQYVELLFLAVILGSRRLTPATLPTTPRPLVSGTRPVTWPVGSALPSLASWPSLTSRRLSSSRTLSTPR